MPRLEMKHPRLTRWFHWLNVPVLSLMIWSGLMIAWANDEHRIGWGNFTIAILFPGWFYEWLRLDHRLAAGMSWHFALMWVFAINGLCYVLYTFYSGEWRYLVPNRRSWGEAWQVVLHDLKLSKIEPPRRKFNGAQQFAYTGIILMGLGSVLTGLAIYKPVQLSWLTFCFGGYQGARAIHFALTIGYCLFVVVHLAQVAKAGWNNFRAMVTGYEIVESGKETYE